MRFWLLVAGLCSISCTTTKFLTQAALGQLELATQGEPLEKAIDDPKTDDRTRMLLQEILRIKSYGKRFGLDMHENYEQFVQLDRRFVVWFVNASEPLAFEPKTFWFPVVGSFPGLSWFDEKDANAFADDLREEGWDVNVRGVTAFSTGGWFDDPVVSSMFAEHPAALGFLVNTLIHESVHATVLVPDQQYFNESLASFVARELTPPYLLEFYGLDALETQEYLAAFERGNVNLELMSEANLALTELYMSELPDAEKLRRKRAILTELAEKVPFESPPNNATLIGVQLYNEGKVEMEELSRVCGSWPRFLKAVASLRTQHFGIEQAPEIGPPLKALSERRCVPFPAPRRTTWSKQVRQQKQRRKYR